MKIIALEEHVSFDEIDSLVINCESKENKQSAMAIEISQKLNDITNQRLNSMDETGISMQILSIENTAINKLSDEKAIDYAIKYNDELAYRIKKNPDSFAAFALLPMAVPEAAADELERTVNRYHFKGAMIKGLIQGEFLDNPKFAPVFERAEKLDVPIYIHPDVPSKQVMDAYYSNIGGIQGYNQSIACYGWGWHSETAIHVLRLFIGGVFDKYPNLKIIIGHMGEMLPMMWDRMNGIFYPGNTGQNRRTLIDTFRKQLFITTSGIFSKSALALTIDTIGIDNILFSVDYPYSSNKQGIDFLNNLDIPLEQLEQLAYKNACKLLKLSST